MNGLRRKSSVSLSSAAKVARLNTEVVAKESCVATAPKENVASENVVLIPKLPQPLKITVENVFYELMSKSGVTLSTGNSPNEINVDKSGFIKGFSKCLKAHRSYPQVVQEFLNCSQSYVGKEDDLVRFLNATTFTSEDENLTQESLFRMLLEVDDIQPGLADIFLEKLAEFSSDENNEDKWSWNIPRLIISQLKFLNRIVDSERFKKKILEVLSVSSIGVQREIISSIPVTISDTDHEEVGRILMELFETESRLSVVILDSLTNMVISSALLNDVQESVLKILDSVNIEQLPVIVKFLLFTARPQDASKVLNGIRLNLDFAGLAISAVPLSQKKMTQQIEKIDYAIMTIDAIQSGIDNIPFMADACLKLLDSIVLAKRHKLLDIFLIFMLCTRQRKKTVYKLLGNKIKRELIDHGLLHEVFSKLSNVAKCYSKCILNIANEFLPSTTQSLSGFASEMYELSFAAFDTYHSQEVLGQLVVHIGSGIDFEVNAGLDVLLHLVEHERARVMPCAVFIQGILDYLDLLKLNQIRKVCQCLAELAYGGNRKESTGLKVEMEITTRKQLSSNLLRYKCIGVIASLMITKSVVASTRDHEDEECVAGVLKLLELVLTSVQNYPNAKALFMDEMSDIIQTHNLEKKFLGWMCGKITTELEESFICELDGGEKAGGSSVNSGKWKLEQHHGIDAESTIIINLLPLVVKDDDQVSREDIKPIGNTLKSAVTLIPNFRLVRICEQAMNNGNADEIDGLLGCPLHFYSPKLLVQFSTLDVCDKNVICKATFLCINWFRELINTFCTQTDEDMRKKVVRRLLDITRLHLVLAMCLTDYPDFVPVNAIYDFDEETSQKAATGSGGKKKSAKKATGKTSKKKKTVQSDTQVGEDKSQMITQTGNNPGKCDDESPQKKSARNEKELLNFDITPYGPYFRELEFDVFTLIHHELYLGAIDDEVPVLKIATAGLHFLLQDLNRKLHFALKAPSVPNRFFGQPKQEKNIMFKGLGRFTPKEIAKKCVTLLPAICKHLEMIYSHFKLVIEANDALLDGPGMYTAESKIVSKCYLSLFETVHEIFSWHGFRRTEHEPLLQEMCHVVSSRISSLSLTPFPESIELVHRYFLKFGDTVPQFSMTVSVLQLLETISSLHETKDFTEQLVPLCDEFLKREWQSMKGAAKNAEYNSNLQFVLRAYLKYHKAECWDGLEKLATVVTAELVEGQSRESNSTTYPSVSRLSFVVLYRAMMENLVGKIAHLSSDNLEDQEFFLAWEIAVRVFQILVSVLREFDGKTTLSICLRNGANFVENFLKRGMPLMEKLFPTRGREIQALLKNLQTSTRFLQNVCSHTKVIKDVALTKYVPRLKKILEQFVYRVQAMLAMHKCAPAFWVGNLKHRNLRGEEISSQIMRVDEESESNQSTVGSNQVDSAVSNEEDLGSENVANEESDKENEDKEESDKENKDKTETKDTSGDETDIEDQNESVESRKGRPSKSFEY